MLEYLYSQGGVLMKEDTIGNVAHLCAEQFLFIGLDDRNRLCGWSLEPSTPHLSYEDFYQQCLRPMIIQSIDELV